MSEINFFVHGMPAPQGSKKAFRRGAKIMLVESSDKVKPWRHDVAAVALEARSKTGVTQPLDGAIAVAMKFYLPRPKGHHGTKGIKESAPRYPTVKPDADKLARAVLDALTGVLYHDDSQVIDLVVLKVYGEPGAEITVTNV